MFSPDNLEHPLKESLSPSSPLVVGETYTRDQIAELIGMPEERRRGNWATGYDRWNGDFYVFCNVGTAGRTGHNYSNRWDGKLLVWRAKNGSKLHQPQIQDMLSGRYKVHIFWRTRDRGPFTFAGQARAHDVQDTSPVQVTWHFEAERPRAQPKASSVSIVREPAAPVWRRGPAPLTGQRTANHADRPDYLYIMRLTGPVELVFPDLPPGHAIIKVGHSADVPRRERELNFGFPFNCLLSWKVVDTRLYPSKQAAYNAEGAILESLRLMKHPLDGEFIIIPEADLPIL